jgi:uncharacterized RDD family membrane protein YckC
VSDLYEKLDVQTPEQISLEFSLAGIGSRALALVYDTLIQVIVALAVTLVIAYYGRSLRLYWIGASNWMTAALIFFLFCLYWGYFAIFEILWNGQTPGKRHAQIRVISASGRPITVFESVARNFLRAVDGTFFYGVAVLAAALSRQNRRLGDMVAGTVVVHDTNRSEDILWYADSSRKPAAHGNVAAVITATEFQLIETFLARRLDLAPELRRKQASAIASRISGKLKLAAGERGSDEDFLEDIARDYRNSSRFHSG